MTKKVKRVKLEKETLTPFVDFDVVSEACGKVINYREVTTKFGTGMVIDLETAEGEMLSVMESAGLKGYKWQDLKEEGATVEIVAGGWGKTANGRFRAFEVYVLE